MKNQWNQFPFVLRRKILLTFLAGLASIALSLIIFIITTDHILLVQMCIRDRVMLLSAEDIQRLSGETVDSSECIAILSRRAFDAAFSKYIEWHTPEPSACALRQLSLDPGCN